MKLNINSKIDCVFKAIFGSEENKDVLIHLLNAVLNPPPEAQITEVKIMNPFNERTFDEGKLSVVDIKAEDQIGRHFQIEMQIQIHPGLKERMLWTWASLYHRHLEKGHDYRELTPTIAIWFVDEDLFPSVDAFHHQFGVLERERHELLCDDLDLRIVEMQKWGSCLRGERDIDLWLEFLNCSSELDPEALPEKFQKTEFKKAVSTIEHFTESDVAHDLYIRRLEYLSIESSWKGAIKEAHENLARAEENAARVEENAARETERAELVQRKLDHALENLIAKGMSESEARSILDLD
jgi:predicted transposase/invertase (TIGR01784 family)